MKMRVGCVFVAATLVANAQTEPWKLIIDGKPVEAPIVETNGNIFIPLAIAARALGRDFQVKGKTISIEAQDSAGTKTNESSPGTKSATRDDEISERLGERVRNFKFQPGDTSDVETMIEVYRSNEVQADNCYKNRLCRMKGTVVRVGKDADGSIFIMMAASSAAFLSGPLELAGEVKCYFPASEAKAVATLSSRDRVIVRGICAGKLGYCPVLMGCHIDAKLADWNSDDPKDLGAGAATNAMPVNIAIPKPAPPPPAPAGNVRVLLTYHSMRWDENRDDYGSQLWLLTEDEANKTRAKYGGDGITLASENVFFLSPEMSRGKSSWGRGIDPYSSRHSDFTKIPPGDYVLVVKSRNVHGRCQRDKLGKFFFQKVTVKVNETTKVSIETGRGP